MRHVPTWFQAALLPDRWRVAGVPCSAITVWHHFILEAVGNAYLYERPCDRNAALELLLYCSRDYQQGRALYTRMFYRGRAERRLARVLRRQEWTDVDAACTDYVKTCLRVPQHKGPPQEIGTNGQLKAPPKARTAAPPVGWILVQHLASGNPDKIEAAWNTPYATARSLFEAHRDIEGKTDTLESVDEESRIDEWIQKNRTESESE